MSDTSLQTVVSVHKVKKNFMLPHERTQSIKSAVLHFWKRKNRTVETQHALRDISFDIKKGEFFGILGRNGSGKSTLLKILAGIYTPSNGKVKVDGKLVPFIELGVGFNPDLTGRENVYLNGALLGFSHKEIDEQYDKIVEFAELEDFMDQKLKNYSSGMQVRLAFSVAIIADADILLVDEVLAVGDADFQRKCYQYFKLLKKNNKTVIFVSHDMSAVREYCDRAILINDSRIIFEGTAESVSQEYLKLFNDGGEVEQTDEKPQKNRWGNNWARFTDVKVTLTDKELVIDLEATGKRDLSDVVYGFRVRNGAGEELLGTNSNIKGKSGLTLQKGQTTSLQWRMPNIFSDGEYYVEPALVLGDGATVCDWWNEAKKFRVTKNDSTNYPVTPDIKLKIGS